MSTLLDKCRIIYKGDYLSGGFYLLVGVFMLISALAMDRWWTKMGLGFHILSIGFGFLAAYSIGKGLYIIMTSRKKFHSFLHTDELSSQAIREEIRFTEYRIAKKKINRRRYIYITVIATIVSFLGIFSTQKAFIMGTAIPIAFITGIEFGIGLLTEFRLSEYLRQLKKTP
jgi:hypothetical protein